MAELGKELNVDPTSLYRTFNGVKQDGQSMKTRH